MDIAFNNNQTMITSIGGHAVRYTNKTGAASVKGKLVKINAAQANSVELTGANSVDCIGVMYSDGVADGSEVWVVVSGTAEVLLDDDTGASVDNWCQTGEAGYCNAESESPIAAPTHFNEVGHALEAATAGGGGTHQMIKINLHFL